MTKLSVNINKIATLRNSRGNNIPNLIQVAKDCERFGAQGITVHPRPDERHITYQDVLDLKEIVTTEFNIEGNPQDRYMELVLRVKPEQATLVPDSADQLTSDHGWDTVKHLSYLQEVIAELKKNGIRTSIFVDPVEKMIEYAAKTGTDRIELYTEPYAANYLTDKYKAVEPYTKAAKLAVELGLGVNAGHDLNLVNLAFFSHQVSNLLEVSIGHALIADALYYGLENTIQLYKRQLNNDE
jgi:pyridoxine 5-phosphate synthase